jgi:hypothetical protein
VSLHVACDRCGTVFTSGILIETSRRENEPGSFVESLRPEPGGIDLCDDCYSDFFEWLKPSSQ